MNCSFCNNTFTNKSILIQHQKNAKYCLLLQGLENNNFNCIYCKKKYSTKQNLDSHQHNCSNKKIKELNKELTESKEKEIEELKKEKDNEKYKEIQELIEAKNKEIKELIEEKDKEIKELKKDIKKLSEEKEKDIQKFEEKDKNIEELKNHIKELENKLENIAIKIGSKPTIVNNNPTNNIKYINKIEKLELTTDQYIKDQVNNLTIDHIKKGCVGYAEYAIKHPFKNRIICVDYARRKIKYKDSDGNVITDPEMSKLSSKLFDSIKSRNKDLTIEFLNTLNPQLKIQMSEDMSNQVAMVNLAAEGEKTDLYFD